MTKMFKTFKYMCMLSKLKKFSNKNETSTCIYMYKLLHKIFIFNR